MKTWGRRVRFTAVLAVVVLALTGFSRGHSHSRHRGGGGGGSGGGGCSNSRQDHDTSTSSRGSSTGGSGTGGTYRSRPAYRATATPSGGRGTARPLQDASARLVSCATAQKPYTTAEVRNPNDRTGSFGVQVTFLGRDGAELGHRYEVTKVAAKAAATLRVEADPGVLARLGHCEVAPTAAAVG